MIKGPKGPFWQKFIFKNLDGVCLHCGHFHDLTTSCSTEEKGSELGPGVLVTKGGYNELREAWNMVSYVLHECVVQRVTRDLEAAQGRSERRSEGELKVGCCVRGTPDCKFR